MRPQAMLCMESRREASKHDRWMESLGDGDAGAAGE